MSSDEESGSAAEGSDPNDSVVRVDDSHSIRIIGGEFKGCNVGIDGDGIDGMYMNGTVFRDTKTPVRLRRSRNIHLADVEGVAPPPPPKDKHRRSWTVPDLPWKRKREGEERPNMRRDLVIRRSQGQAWSPRAPR